MDLIYTDDQFHDLGVLQNYTMDMAYGIDENDFEIKLPIHAPECVPKGYIYVENTEIGGIIDCIGADTTQKLLIYKGRTWNGLLANRVIEPDAGMSHYTATGEANQAVLDIIIRCDLYDVFDVEGGDSGIIIDSFDFRYDDVNTGLFCMLLEYDAKLIMRVHDGKCFLHVEPLINYAGSDEFDSSQLDMTLIQRFAECNHLICLGQGLNENRHVIHIFTDEFGGVLPYATAEDPIKDADYILDKSNQLITGKDEYTEVYDYPDASETENYECLMEKPDDWDKNYDKYYEIPDDYDEDDPEPEPEEDVGDNYTEIERRIEDVYKVTTSQPEDWTTNYEDYYIQVIDQGEISYEPVEPDSDTAFIALQTKPADWKKNYNKYYHKVNNKWKRLDKVPKYVAISKRPKDWTKSYGNYYVTDGAGNWSTVSGVSKPYYKKQTQEPSDWAANWGDYYVEYKNTSGEWHKHKLSDDSYYSRLSHAPKWKKNTFYVQRSKTIAPAFSSSITYYSKKLVVPAFSNSSDYYTGPYYRKDTSYYKTWTADTYYKLYPDQDIGVEFVPGRYFKKWIDHYAELVAGGLDRLEELNNSDELVIDLVHKQNILGSISMSDGENTYDIGDIVGGTEEITGVFTAQPITKKIVNIAKDIMTVQHEVR